MYRFHCTFALFLLAACRGHADSPAKDSPLFTRHVGALLSRLGCNAGTCHGAVKGQNGFRLSLFGADPALDHDRLLREFGGRRLNVAHPDASLLLLKATGQVTHEGGKRMEVGSTEYEVLRRWIAAGAILDPLDKSRLTELRVQPAEQTLKPGENYQLKVEAKFADGSVEDVTSFCSFESVDKNVATVQKTGQVRALGAGDCALIIRYRSDPALARAIVPRPAGEPFPAVSGNNFIDQHILAKLRRLNIHPSTLADDATFLRRVSLDVAGELPSPKEIRAFLADKDPGKRNKKIDELLVRPGHGALWTLKFCDLLKASNFGVYADALTQEADAPRFQQWIRARLEENTPYDQFVERVLTATSREGRGLEEWAKEVNGLFEGNTTPRTDLALYSKRKTLDLYWQRDGANGVAGALQIAHAFLGLRLECAQCHRHPHDVWQQDDLLSFANFFMRVRRPGFQGDNDKKYPEVAAYTKKLTAESKALADEVKKLRETREKKLAEDIKKAKAEADKAKNGPEAYKSIQVEYDQLRKEIAEKERRGRFLQEVEKRMLHSEVSHVPAAKDTFANVTSPLGSQSSKKFRLLGQTQALEVSADQDPRLAVAAWLRRPDNPYFAKAIVNRVWAHYFGRGIIDPPDHLSPLNPASHPELLDELCGTFVKGGYNLKELHRLILSSRAYQQSSTATAANDMDRSNYAYFYLRRIGAEILVDALNQSTGTKENMDMKYYHWPENLKTVEIPYTPRNDFVTFMLEQFGRPQRNPATQCDCERDQNASVLQVLSFANHPRVWQKIADDKGHVARIVKELPSDGERIDELFLATLSRLPMEPERQACMKFLMEAESPAKGLQGIMWSLLNTREFVLQH